FEFYSWDTRSHGDRTATRVLRESNTKRPAPPRRDVDARVSSLLSRTDSLAPHRIIDARVVERGGRQVSELRAQQRLARELLQARHTELHAARGEPGAEFLERLQRRAGEIGGPPEAEAHERPAGRP